MLQSPLVQRKIFGFNRPSRPPHAVRPSKSIHHRHSLFFAHHRTKKSGKAKVQTNVQNWPTTPHLNSGRTSIRRSAMSVRQGPVSSNTESAAAGERSSLDMFCWLVHSTSLSSDSSHGSYTGFSSSLICRPCPIVLAGAVFPLSVSIFYELDLIFIPGVQYFHG
jgi:hypothetical protein